MHVSVFECFSGALILNPEKLTDKQFEGGPEPVPVEGVAQFTHNCGTHVLHGLPFYAEQLFPLLKKYVLGTFKNSLRIGP